MKTESQFLPSYQKLGNLASSLKPESYVLLCILLFKHLNFQSGRCFPSHRKLAEEYGCTTTRNIGYLISDLKKAGLIWTINELGRSSNYFFSVELFHRYPSTYGKRVSAMSRSPSSASDEAPPLTNYTKKQDEDNVPRHGFQSLKKMFDNVLAKKGGQHET